MGLTRIYNKINDTCETEVINTNAKSKICYFCEGNHVCRECPQETLLAPVLKKYIGKTLYNYSSDLNKSLAEITNIFKYK